MGDDALRKAFLQGYEEGLKAAWRDIGSLTTRGYSSTELGVMAKSKLAVLHRDVEAMASRLDKEGEAFASPVRGTLGGRGAYFVEEPKADRIFDLFRALLDAGARGLCITRIHPDDYRVRYRLPDAGYVWLSKTAGRKERGIAIVEPTALVDLASAIADFSADNGNAAVLLEGIEYLIAQNGFSSMERFIQKVNERIVLNESYLLVSVNPGAMKDQEYKLLAREMVGAI